MNIFTFSFYQLFHIGISGAFCIILVIAHFFLPPERRMKPIVIFGYGLLISLFGVIFFCLTKKECVELLLFLDTGGFGRAYISGIGVMMASFVIWIVNLLQNLIKKINQ